MSFFEFPHTRTYDSDLGWLIKKMEELANEYTIISNWMNTHQSEYGQLVNRVTALENEINTFESEIEERFNELQEGLERYIFEQVQQALAVIIADLADLEEAVQQLRIDLQREIYEIYGLIEGKDAVLRDWVEARLEQFKAEIPDLTTVNVFNPIKGYVTSIQEAINDLYGITRTDGLTAAEYDSLQLTAAEYDALDLTAFEYDNFAKDILGQRGIYKNYLYYMNSPFSGEYVTIITVINELAALHKGDALTASEYDAKELTAQAYDDMQMTAYNYDWLGGTLIP